MPPSAVRRVLGSIPRLYPPNFLRVMVRIFLHLLRIAVSILLLPLDNATLLAAYFVNHLSLPWSTVYRRRRSILKNPQFDPKTILITGVNSPQGLALARCWHYDGHRVIGAELTDFPVRPGESKSNTLAAFYDIAKPQYIYRLLEIIHREKVDLWIPCSEQVDVLGDATVKQTIESRTDCRCVHLDPELAKRFGSSERLRRFLVEKDLPAVENHEVQSRASVHKVLHRSPGKAYVLWKPDPAGRNARPRDDSKDKALSLPKRTLSMTYSDVSEVHINKENPWVLQQQPRIGEFFAEMLVVRGSVKAITIRPGDQQSAWGSSRLDQGLANAIHRLMDRFAKKGGRRFTGHLCVHVMVDEEFESNLVRHVVHIADCRQGSASCKTLLQNPPSTITSGYLSLLSSPLTSEDSGDPNGTAYSEVETTISAAPSSTHNQVQLSGALRPVPLLSLLTGTLEEVVQEARQLPFWKDARFSYLDPLPWWWHAHIYTPFHELDQIFSRNPSE